MTSAEFLNALKQIAQTEVDDEPCVMCDINSRLPKHALSWLDAAMPSPEDSAESSAASYRSMERYLMENRHTIFPNATTDWCVVHNRRCSLFPESCQPDDDQLQPLVMNFAGTTCRGWRSAGKSRLSAILQRDHMLFGSLRGVIALKSCKKHFSFLSVRQDTL